MDLHTLPSIDWKLAETRCGNHQWAEEMIFLLLKRLPEDIQQIKEAFNKKDLPQTLQLVHKLHGAVAYCGMPRLNLLISSLETSLKNHIMDGSLLEQLDSEANLLITEEFTRLPQCSDADKNG